MASVSLSTSVTFYISVLLLSSCLFLSCWSLLYHFSAYPHLCLFTLHFTFHHLSLFLHTSLVPIFNLLPLLFFSVSLETEEGGLTLRQCKAQRIKDFHSLISMTARNVLETREEDKISTDQRKKIFQKKPNVCVCLCVWVCVFVCLVVRVGRGWRS